MVSQVVVNNTLHKAEVLKKAGNLEQAWVLYEKLYRHLPKDLRVVSGLANLEDARGKIKRARGLLKSIVSPNSDYAVTGLLAMHYYRSGSYYSALRLCLSSLKKEPDNVAIYSDIGDVLCFIKLTNRALPYLERAVQLNSESYRLGMLYADALYSDKQYRSANEKYESVLQTLKVDDLRLLQEKKALCLFKMGEDEAASEIILSFYTFDLGVARNDYEKLDFVGNNYLDKGQVELAELILRYVNRCKPILFTLLGEAECLMSKSEWDAAELVLEKVPENERSRAGFLYLYAKLHGCTGRFNAALKIITKCLSKEPDHQDAQYIKAYILDGLYRFAEAESLLVEVLGRDRAHTDANKCLAHIYFAQGIWDKAFYYYQHRVDEKAQFKNLVQSISYFKHWDGKRKLKKLMLIDEQGIGDKIRYAFFYKALSQYVEEIVVVTDNRLKTLFERSFDGLTVVAKTGFPPTKYAVDHGVQELFSVPDLGCVFYASLADNVAIENEGEFTRGQGYLQARSELVQYWSEVFELKDGVINIGICWRGPVEKVGRESWYSRLQELLTIFSGIEHRINIVPLQYNMSQSELSLLDELCPDNLVDTDIDMRDDFEGMAGVIGALDLVITPATALAELSGALGIPTWLFATKDRKKWNLDGKFMNGFYPSVETLFSNKPWGDVNAMMRDRITAHISYLS